MNLARQTMRNPRPRSTSGELPSALMCSTEEHPSLVASDGEVPLDRRQRPLYQSDCTHDEKKAIWVTNEHLNLLGSASATPESDGHSVLLPCPNVGQRQHISAQAFVLNWTCGGFSRVPVCAGRR